MAAHSLPSSPKKRSVSQSLPCLPGSLRPHVSIIFSAACQNCVRCRRSLQPVAQSHCRSAVIHGLFACAQRGGPRGTGRLGGSDGRVRQARSRQHRGCVGAAFQIVGRALFASNGGSVHPFDRASCGIVSTATGPFYCPSDERSISTRHSSASCRNVWARTATSRRHTWSSTRSAITYNTVRYDAAVRFRSITGGGAATQPGSSAQRTAGRLLYRRLGVLPAEAKSA